MKKGVFKKNCVHRHTSTLLSFKETLIKKPMYLKDIGDETTLAYFFFVEKLYFTISISLSLANISCKVQCLNKRKKYSNINQC
jgi:hypothetical protein